MQNNKELHNTGKQATYKLTTTNVLVRPTGDRHPFKVKPIWILMKQEMMKWQWCLDDMQSFAPCSRQIAMPIPHYSISYRQMLFLMPKQQG